MTPELSTSCRRLSLLLGAIILLMPSELQAQVSPGPAGVRIKDITTLQGEDSNKLVGIGLVAGLNGTGGKGNLTRRLQALSVQNLGLRADPQILAQIGASQDKTDNLSVVMVTAELRAYARGGQRMDVTVAALDDAKSLAGGNLITANLEGYDGEIYAVASGPVSLNGGNFGGDAAQVTKNHPTTGRIHDGATIVRTVPATVVRNGTFTFLLDRPDYETALQISNAVNGLASRVARVIAPSEVRVVLPYGEREDPHAFISACQKLTVQPDHVARVIINERTGTVTFGAHVTLSEVAIAHGNIIITTTENPQVSQPPALSGGQTAVVPRSQVEVTEQEARVTVLPPTTSVGELAAALNALGVSPRDLSIIFQQLSDSGMLHARVELR